MGATHFLMKTLPRVSGEMALHILAYNLTRVLNILGARTMLVSCPQRRCCLPPVKAFPHSQDP
jgi:transposase